ncbi:unnamed protein product, partial [Staurois parvus]
RQHWWVGTGGWHLWAQVGGHRWVALLGTCRWHFWAQIGGTAEWHRWVHCWAQVGALLGTGGCTGGHGWAELVGALLGGTCGWHCWAPIIRALIITCHWTPL